MFLSLTIEVNRRKIFLKKFSQKGEGINRTRKRLAKKRNRVNSLNLKDPFQKQLIKPFNGSREPLSNP